MRRNMPATKGAWWIAAIDSATKIPSAIGICIFLSFSLESSSRALSSLSFLGLFFSLSVMSSSSLKRAQIRWKRACTSK